MTAGVLCASVRLQGRQCGLAAARAVSSTNLVPLVERVPALGIPDFFIAGPPKAGTTALHAALATHPDLFLAGVKEPKYFLCDDRPPRTFTGPGDAHSAQEWIWRRGDYEALFAAAPTGTLTGESSPFYLFDLGAQSRIWLERPDARFIVILRDPIDRAHSNWAHLWADGLEPEADFVAACRLEEVRRQAGWAPFWRYRALGRYGRQLKHLTKLFGAEQVHWLRYRDLVEDPGGSLDRICAFLGVSSGVVAHVPPANVKPYVRPSRRNQVLQSAVRAGASVGKLLPPQLWRRASVPLLRALGDQAPERPALQPHERLALLDDFRQDVALLEAITGSSFSDWLTESGRGAYSVRRS